MLKHFFEQVSQDINHCTSNQRCSFSRFPLCFKNDLNFQMCFSSCAATLTMTKHPPQRKTFSPSKMVGRISQPPRDSQRTIKIAAAGALCSIGPRCLTSVAVDMVISSFATLTPKMKGQFRKA